MTDSNAIDFITIQTTGNAKDFGDLTTTTKKIGLFRLSWWHLINMKEV